jgi:hypothetical protein
MRGIVTKLNDEWVVKSIKMPTIGRKVEYVYYPLETEDINDNNLFDGREVEFYLFDKSNSLDLEYNVVAKIENKNLFLKIPLDYINELIKEYEEEKDICGDAMCDEMKYNEMRSKIDLLYFLKEKFL